MTQPIKISDDTFKAEVLDSDKPVLVDFWAPWCGPCRMLSPIIDELARESNGDLVVGKVDIDDNPETAAQFGVRSIPTLMLFKGGKLVSTKTGVQPKSAILDWIKSA